jgi:hypothetical protein
MYPSYALCRAQEKVHQDCAASATLPNVRRLSERAALVWAAEAVAAEKREERDLRRRGISAAIGEQKRQSREAYDRQFSENPDADLTPRVD